MATVAIPRKKNKRQVLPREELTGPVILFRMTSDRFCDLPPGQDVKLELLDGEVIMSPRPIPAHQYFLGGLLVVLMQWTKARRLGRVLLDTLVKLDGGWTLAPDIVFVARKHLKRVKRNRIEGSVDLAVEILSSSTANTDRETKFATYARYGVKWYWIADLENRTLEEYELTGKGYGRPVEVPFDEPFEPRLFPGLVIDLASLEW